MAPRLLDQEEITRQLTDLPGWRLDGRTLHASYDAPDFPTAVRLVAEIGDAAETMDHHPDIDLRWRTVHLACSTHSAGGVTQLDIELAHQIMVAASGAGAKSAPPPPRTWELALDVVDPVAVREFWREALGYVEVPVADGTIELHDPAGIAPRVWFQTMDPPRSGRDRFHLDLYRSRDDVAALRERLVAAGGRLVSEEHAPDWWVMADAEGNIACVCTA
jgi:4a-hydroxytetrahydrobiopterin dehydratase